jgi:hypothetical protein
MKRLEAGAATMPLQMFDNDIPRALDMVSPVDVGDRVSRSSLDLAMFGTMICMSSKGCR